MKVFKQLYVQVLIGVVLGIAAGLIWPSFTTHDAAGAATAHPGIAEQLKPLGDAFVNVIKMIIAPIIFTTVAIGIARMSDMKAFGRVGVRALIYFEVVSTVALILGWAVAYLAKPGVGADMTHNDAKALAALVEQAHHYSIVSFLMGIIPTSFVSAFTDGNMLQVLFIAILTGFACSRLGEFGVKCANAMDAVAKVFFSIIHILVKAAPIGAFGAMAFTVGKYGLHTLLSLGILVGLFYITIAVFIVVVLGLICMLLGGFSFFKFFRYIREEFLIVLGASSSEAALPQLMEKLQRLGVPKSVVGLVVPAGYSFNLDGTNIYMTMAILFIAQATGTPLSVEQTLTMFLITMLTSKGASGVTGAGFLVLIATVQQFPAIPLASLGVLLGIERFMSLGRALTNFIGNGVATLVIARWEGVLDRDVLNRELNAGPARAELDEVTEAEPV